MTDELSTLCDSFKDDIGPVGDLARACKALRSEKVHLIGQLEALGRILVQTREERNSLRSLLDEAHKRVRIVSELLDNRTLSNG